MIEDGIVKGILLAFRIERVILDTMMMKYGYLCTIHNSQGSYPTFATNAIEDKKKKEISEFIEREK